MNKPDLRTMRDDDQLLDRLGRNEPFDGYDGAHRDDYLDDGGVEAMLATWRATLPAAGPPDERLVAAVATAVAPKPVRRVRRLVRASLGVAASIGLLGGGLTVAAAYAGPNSPLWPVTQLVYRELAESRAAVAGASQAVSDARSAAGQHRYADAARLLAKADALVGKVDEPDDVRLLQADIAKVRGLLPANMPSPDTEQVPADPTESLGVDPPSIAPGHGPGGDPDTGRGDSDSNGDNDGERGGGDDNSGDDNSDGNDPPGKNKPGKGKGKPGKATERVPDLPSPPPVSVPGPPTGSVVDPPGAP